MDSIQNLEQFGSRNVDHFYNDSRNFEKLNDSSYNSDGYGSKDSIFKSKGQKKKKTKSKNKPNSIRI